MTRSITIHPVTRIEGHARIILDVDDQQQVAGAHLQVLEMRGFEKLLQGMELFKVPLLASRICGVCPAAQLLASVVSIENGLGVKLPADGEALRELLYMGHILHSHALSVFVLCGPDLYNAAGATPAERSVFHLLKVEPELAKQMLRLRSVGQRVVEMVGGRGVHPVTAIPGGMAARPAEDEMQVMAKSGLEAVGILEALAAAIRDKVAALEESQAAPLDAFHALSLSEGGTVSFLKGDWKVADRAGAPQRSFQAADYGQHLVEHVSPGSYMKTVRLKGSQEQSYFVGPLARLNLNERMSTPKADALLKAFRARGSRWTTVDFIEARVIEMMHTAERIAQLAGGGIGKGPILVECRPRAGRYVGAIEAPRGMLLHDYTADEAGRVLTANMVVATQNNYDAIDASLKAVGEIYLPKGDEALLMNRLEFALRCFDPCLACATHAVGRMPMEVILRGPRGEERRIVRRAQP
jgi:F420-non-reducing hydrogenase large subunit